MLEVRGKRVGDFTQEDGDVLLQLAQMATIAIENILYTEERETNRLKDEFLATVSHELRTPLGAILTWTRMLRGGKVEAAALERGIEVIERNAKAQGQLVGDLLFEGAQTRSTFAGDDVEAHLSLPALGTTGGAGEAGRRPAAPARPRSRFSFVTAPDRERLSALS